eukprot:g4966.t1
MSGKLVSQLKDEETIENALKSCLENVRSMKSGAVLTEVLALLKNEEYAKDALTVLGNFLSNSSEEKKSMASYFLKTLLKMKELIPEEIDVFVPFLKNQDTKNDAWICVENCVSDTFGKAKKNFSESALDMVCMVMIRLCQRKPSVFNLSESTDSSYRRVDAMKAELRRALVLDSLVSGMLLQSLKSSTRGHVEKTVNLLLLDFSQVTMHFVSVSNEFVKLILQGVASLDTNTSSVCARILRILLNNLETRSLVRGADGIFVVCNAWRTLCEEDDQSNGKKS